MAKIPSSYTKEDKHNWEVEKLKAEHRNLGISFWTAIIIALVAIFGTVGNIIFSQNQKVLSEINKKELDLEAKELETETNRLKKERDSLQAEKTRISQELLSLAQKSDKKESIQLEKLATEITNNSVPQSTSSTNLPARIYLQYLRSQENKVARVIEELKKQGYRVFPKAVSSSARKREIFVGYYYETDKTEAETLLNTLKKLNPSSSNQKPKLIKGGARPRHYDVWIALSDNG